MGLRGRLTRVGLLCVGVSQARASTPPDEPPPRRHGGAYDLGGIRQCVARPRHPCVLNECL